MSLLKIKIELDAAQFKSEGADVKKVAGEGSASFDGLTAKVTAFSFAFNQITQVAGQVARALSEPLQVFSELQSGMANVESLGVPNIQSLTSEILDMSGQVSVPISSLTAGLYEVVSAGADSANQIEVLDQSARAAKAGLSQTNEALKLSSAVVKAFGLDWGETGGILDRAFQTVKLGQTTFPELAQNLGVVAPLAAALKINIDELFGSFATLTGVTGNTNIVATQLRAIMAALADPTNELTDLIKKQTGQTIEQVVASKGLAGILKIIGDATGGSAAEMTKYFGRIEAVNAALALSGSQYESLLEKTTAMTDSTGAMTDAFEIQNQTIEAQVQLLQNRWDAALSRAVAVSVPFINSVFDIAFALTDTRGNVEKLSQSIEELNSRMKQVDSLEVMLARYEELQSKTDLAAEEQEELRKIVAKLAELYPNAIARINEYGDAVEINASKVKLLLEAERALLRQQEKDDVKDATKDLQKYTETISIASDEFVRLNKVIDDNDKLAKEFRHDADVWAHYGMKVLQATNEQTELNKKLDEANEELPELLLLLSNYFDLDASDSNLMKSLELNETQLNVLRERWQQLNQEIKEGQQTTGNTVTEVANKATSAVNAASLQMREAEKKRHVSRIANIYDEQDAFVEQVSAEANAAADAAQAKLQAEIEFNEKKKELQTQAFEQTLGHMAGLMTAAQGTNAALFSIGKGAALAETIYNTYASATAAYKAMAGIPFVGPGLAVAAAAAAVASGLANAQRIAATKFEKRFKGGFLGDEIRTVFAHDFGDGENRMIIANNKEYIVNAAATANNRAILDAINYGGASFVPVQPTGGAVGAAHSTSVQGVGKKEFDKFRNDMVGAISNLKIIIRSEMDTLQFFREHYEEYENDENDRRI